MHFPSRLCLRLFPGLLLGPPRALRRLARAHQSPPVRSLQVSTGSVRFPAFPRFRPKMNCRVPPPSPCNTFPSRDFPEPLPRAPPQFPHGIPKVHQNPLVSFSQVLPEAPCDFLCPRLKQNELQGPPTLTQQCISLPGFPCASSQGFS